MYDDPMREQMRQAHRLARLQAITGQASMPGVPGMQGMAQTAPATPAPQPFDFARNLTSSLGGTAGWVGGAHLAGKIVGSLPHPAAKVAGWAIPTVAMLAGSSAIPAAVDAVSPSIHDTMNAGFSKAGPAGLLGAAGLAGYMAYRNRKGLGAIGDDVANALTHKPMNPAQIHSPVMTDMVGVPARTRMMDQASGQMLSHGHTVPHSPVMLHPPASPTMQQAAANVMTDIVKDPLMASQPIPMAASLAQHVAPSMWREPSKAVQGYTRSPVTHLPQQAGQMASPDAFVQDLARRRAIEIASTPRLSRTGGMIKPDMKLFRPNSGTKQFKPIDHDLMAGHGQRIMDQQTHAMDMMNAGYHPHEAMAMAEALHPAPGIAPIPATPEGNVYRPGFALKKNKSSRKKSQ